MLHVVIRLVRDYKHESCRKKLTGKVVRVSEPLLDAKSMTTVLSCQI